MTRSAQAVLDVVAGIDPANNFGLLPHRRAIGEPPVLTSMLTCCNIAINALTTALGCPVPVTMKANQQHDWLVGPAGHEAGWMTVDAETARLRAATGFPTIAVWKNPTSGPGHIMLVVPSPPNDAAHLYVAGAGSRNFNSTRIENSFGLSIQPAFLTHD